MSPILDSIGSVKSFGWGSLIPVTLANPSFESIATVTVGAGGSSGIDFTSIPQTFTHLQIRGVIRDTTSGAAFNNLSHRLNGDSGNIYYSHRVYGTGATTASDTPGNPATNLNTAFYTASNGYDAGLMAPVIWDLLDYKNTNKKKVIRSICGGDGNGSGLILLTSGLWNSTDAITSISIYGATFVQNTRLALYGIKEAV